MLCGADAPDHFQQRSASDKSSCACHLLLQNPVKAAVGGHSQHQVLLPDRFVSLHEVSRKLQAQAVFQICILQVAMECAKEMGCKASIVDFVMPLGTTVNMNGTALYEATTVIFLAQVCRLRIHTIPSCRRCNTMQKNCPWQLSVMQPCLSTSALDCSVP